MPKYMKDESGFCYAWTETLATQKRLTAYDGEVDAGGFATDKPVKADKPVKPEKPAKAPKADVEPDAPTTNGDPLDAALAAAKLD